MRVKLFTSEEIENLEADINEWLEAMPDGTEIYGLTVNYSEGQFAAVASYGFARFDEQN